MGTYGDLYPCYPRQKHNFDYHSGWCTNGCGVREDGRRTDPKTGELLAPGPSYTAQEIDRFRQRHARRTPYPRGNNEGS